MFSCKFAKHFQNIVSLERIWRAASEGCFLRISCQTISEKITQLFVAYHIKKETTNVIFMLISACHKFSFFTSEISNNCKVWFWPSGFDIPYDLFHATGHFLYPLKVSENFWFSCIFRGYRNRLVAENVLRTFTKYAASHACWVLSSSNNNTDRQKPNSKLNIFGTELIYTWNHKT